MDTIGRFCSFFLQNVSFIYVTKPQNLFGVVWMGFNPLKQPRKLTLGVFQNLLSKGSHRGGKVMFFLTLFKQGGGGVNPCSKIMSEIVVCSGGHLTT